MNSFWDRIFWGNTLHDWTIAIGIILGSMVLLRLIQAVVISRIRKLASHSRSTLDDFIIDLVQSNVMPLLYIISAYAGLQYLALPAKVIPVLRIAVMVAVTFFILRMITSFVSYTFRQALNRNTENKQREKQAKGILLIVQVVIWALGILFLVDNLGYDITTLVAGLGIGGIAIALAAQTILGDLFSYLVIFFDKPFEIGDFIILDTKMGTVEYIGVKTTHIRTLSGEQLIISNTDLTNSRVHNYKRMQERRVLFTIGVVYNTPRSKLALIPGWIKGIVEQVEGTRFDRAHFFSFGNFSLNFEVVYYVLSPDYNKYMDIQQQINFQIFELFQQQEVEFAFPTQTIYIDSGQKDDKQPSDISWGGSAK